MSSIMFREDEEGNVYGVPNDLDLAPLLSGLHSLRRSDVSVRLFMALGLQNPHRSQVHRHDLESLCYVLVMLTPPFDTTKFWADLKSKKIDFLLWREAKFIISCIAPGFKQFEEWLISVGKQLGLGSIKRQEVATQPMLSVWPIDERLYPAIKATLGGQYMTRLNEDLLEIRCLELGL
ncbi:hypothetical protein CPB85DRAFT_1437630 [Mucidula mucida]|nr:hypothetical protein CPB85DRAFT_1437630 [Mucidula mucida]